MSLVMVTPAAKPSKNPALPSSAIERDPRWAALLRRDPAAEGQFVYSVATTGVYCRPTCPSRRPRPENVAFYATTTEAEKAGFRPCQRCKPTEAPAAERHAALIAEACRRIERAETAPSLDTLAAKAGLSPSHFHRLFKSITGLTPKAYAAAHRAERVRAELADGKSSVTEAIYGAGFNASSRFYEKAKDVLGMTPSAYRAGGADADIMFAIGQCSLGAILVARSTKGVCAILIGDDPEKLIRDLQDRFPKANLIGGDKDFEALVAKVVGFVEAPAIGLDLPLDVRGTAFQQRVWEALRKIPAGDTASYADVAKQIGAPKAVRAVAQACASNMIAVAIPCHRVVRNDGALSGYRWGVERKRALLAKEQAA
jgi:AraC family transcriptional regulator, regulatory protein of adaptative response / methylated-DNA-[protein]-cysteine methyltransferase